MLILPSGKLSLIAECTLVCGIMEAILACNFLLFIVFSHLIHRESSASIIRSQNIVWREIYKNHFVTSRPDFFLNIFETVQGVNLKVGVNMRGQTNA